MALPPASAGTNAAWGEFLSDLRAYRGLTAAEVDARAGLPAGTCRHYEERIEVEPWASLVARLAALLEVPASELLSPTGHAAECEKGRCGSQLRAVRCARGLTLTEAAKACGLTMSDVRRIEQGDSGMEVHAPVLFRLAEVLNVPLYDLLAPM